MNKGENKIYLVNVYLSDRAQELTVFETDVKQQSDECLEKLVEHWQDCVENRKPFRVEHPKKMAFSPSLVFEVSIEEMTLEEYKNQQSEYHRQMKQMGMSGFMGKNFAGA